MKTILYILITALLFACNGTGEKPSAALKHEPDSISDEGNNVLPDDDQLPDELIQRAAAALKKKGFEFPSKADFDKTISLVYELSLADAKYETINLRPVDFPEIAVPQSRFILLQDPAADEPFFISDDLLYHYNNYIFYRNSRSYEWLQRNAKESLQELVTYYGFNQDKVLIQWVLENFDFNSLSKTEDLLFTDSDSGKVLKQDLFDDIDNIIYNGATEDFSYAKEGDGYIMVGEIIERISQSPSQYANPEETIAFLLDRELRVGITGDASSYLNDHPDFAQKLGQHRFYGNELLSEYIQTVYLPDTGD